MIGHDVCAICNQSIYTKWYKIDGQVTEMWFVGHRVRRHQWSDDAICPQCYWAISKFILDLHYHKEH
jgi:hypothetical protein